MPGDDVARGADSASPRRRSRSHRAVGAGIATHGPVTGRQTCSPLHSSAARASRALTETGDDRRRDRERRTRAAPHSALRNQSDESALPSRSRTAAARGERGRHLDALAVAWRGASRARGRRLRAVAALGASENVPPVVLAISRSVGASGATTTRSLRPPGRGTSTTASPVPSATVETGTPTCARARPPGSGRMSPAVWAPSESSSTAAGDGSAAGCCRCRRRLLVAVLTEGELDRAHDRRSRSPCPSRAGARESATRAASRSVVGGSTGSAEVENETIPTLYSLRHLLQERLRGAPSRPRTGSASRRWPPSSARCRSPARSSPRRASRRCTMCGPRDADDEQRQRDERERRRHVAPPSRATRRRGSGREPGSRTAPPRGGAGARRAIVEPDEQRDRGETDERERPDEGHRAPPAHEDREVAQPVAVGRERDVGDAGRRELARHRRALGGRRGGEPLAEARSSSCRPGAAGRSRGRRARASRPARGPARAGRAPRSRRPRAGRRGGGAVAASRAGRGSRRRSRRALAGGPRPRPAGAPRRARRPRRRRGRRLVRRASASSRPTRPARPWVGASTRSDAPKPTRPTRFPRTDAACPTASATPSATSALRRVGGAERHRRRRVEDDPRDEHALGEVDADVRLRRPRGDVPVDLAHVVPRHVRAHLRQLGAAAEQGRPVVAGEQPVDAPGDRQLERLEQRVGHGPGPGSVRGRLGAERTQDADHAAAGLPSSSRGCGTAAITASSTSSADRSSASAWYVSTSRWRKASFTSARMSPGIT